MMGHNVEMEGGQVAAARDGAPASASSGSGVTGGDEHDGICAGDTAGGNNTVSGEPLQSPRGDSVLPRHPPQGRVNEQGNSVREVPGGCSGTAGHQRQPPRHNGGSRDLRGVGTPATCHPSTTTRARSAHCSATCHVLPVPSPRSLVPGSLPGLRLPCCLLPYGTTTTTTP